MIYAFDRLLWKLGTSLRVLKFEFQFAFCVLQNYGSKIRNNGVCVCLLMHVYLFVYLSLFLIINHYVSSVNRYRL